MGINLYLVLVKIVQASSKISLKLFFLLLFSVINILGSSCRPCCEDDHNNSNFASIYVGVGIRQNNCQDKESISNDDQGKELISNDDQGKELISNDDQGKELISNDDHKESISNELKNIPDYKGAEMLPMLYDKITFKEGKHKSIKTKNQKLKCDTGLVKKNINKECVDWDEYDKYVKDYELELSNKNISNNPFTTLLPLYCILESKYKKFYEEYDKVLKGYQRYLRNDLLQKKTKQAGFYDYLVEYEKKMSENITNGCYYKKLATKLDGASINILYDLDEKNDRKVAFVKIGTYKYLQKVEKDISISKGVIMYKIQDCFYKILSNKLKLPIEKVKKIFDPCFVCEKKTFDGSSITLSSDQIKSILTAYYDICKFHNVTFLVLHFTNDQNSIYSGNADIKKHYENVGDVLNIIHSNIIDLLNRKSIK